VKQASTLSFKNSCISKWNVNSHLVTVEVGVESRTNQWVQAELLFLQSKPAESLNT
jgi:hypothetical protein